MRVIAFAEESEKFLSGEGVHLHIANNSYGSNIFDPNIFGTKIFVPYILYRLSSTSVRAGPLIILTNLYLNSS